MIVPVDQWYRASMPPFPGNRTLVTASPSSCMVAGSKARVSHRFAATPIEEVYSTAFCWEGSIENFCFQLGIDWRRPEQERQGQAEGHESDMCTTGVGAQEKNGISAGSVTDHRKSIFSSVPSRKYVHIVAGL